MQSLALPSVFILSFFCHFAVWPQSSPQWWETKPFRCNYDCWPLCYPWGNKSYFFEHCCKWPPLQIFDVAIILLSSLSCDTSMLWMINIHPYLHEFKSNVKEIFRLLVRSHCSFMASFIEEIVFWRLMLADLGHLIPQTVCLWQLWKQVLKVSSPFKRECILWILFVLRHLIFIWFSGVGRAVPWNPSH